MGKYSTLGSIIPTRSPGRTPLACSSPATWAAAVSSAAKDSSTSSRLIATWSGRRPALRVSSSARLGMFGLLGLDANEQLGDADGALAAGALERQRGGEIGAVGARLDGLETSPEAHPVPDGERARE